MIRKILYLLIAFTAISSAQSTDTMLVKWKSGAIVRYAVTSVNVLSFSGKQGTDTLNVQLNSGFIDQYSISLIDNISFTNVQPNDSILIELQSGSIKSYAVSSISALSFADWNISVPPPLLSLLQFKILSHLGNPITEIRSVELVGNYEGIYRLESFSKRKDILSSGQIEFDKNDLDSFGNFVGNIYRNWTISRINLYNNLNQLKGHIVFSYGIKRYSNQERVNAIIFYHDDMSPEMLPSTILGKWNYFNVGEKAVTMLIPPNEHFENTFSTNKPVLFVHGVSGSYPYWGDGMIKNYDGRYDVWQFYYPYDAPIEWSGILLGRAINQFKLNGGMLGATPYSNNVSVVAHSMGGLVTRSYIQSNAYNDNDKIRKLLMLGTPNHGAYSAYRCYYEFVTGIFSEWFLKNKDNEAPAYKDMSPASDFIIALNSKPPKTLLSSASDNSKNYLVIAGTKNVIGAFHEEITNQHDGVVAVSSANLLEYDIPLATLSYGHYPKKDIKGLSHDVSKELIQNILDDSFVPSNLVNDSDITSVWLTNYNIKNNTVSFSTDKGILLLQIPGSATNTFAMSVDGTTLNLLSGSDGNWRMNRIPETYNYFSQSLTGSGLNLQYHGIGSPLENKDYSLVFYKSWLHSVSGFPFAEISNTLKPIPMQTVIANINLSEGQLSILNSKSSGGTVPQIAATRNGAVKYILKNRKNLSNAKSVFEQTYDVDAMVSGVSFYINTEIKNSDFGNNGLQLVTPTGAIIDSAAASTTAGMEFHQDTTLGFAFYYVANPLQGTWKIQYNSSIPGTNVQVPLSSTLDLAFKLLDSVIVKNQPINFSLTIPDSISVTNPNAVMSFYSFNATEDTLQIISTTPMNYDFDAKTFTGNVTPPEKGSYYLSIDFNGTVNGNSIKRTISQKISVDIINSPYLMSPNDGVDTLNGQATLQWYAVNNASVYRAQLYSGSDNIAQLDTIVVNNTLLQLNNLRDGQHYSWRIAAITGNDTSNWSAYWSFSTLTDVPPSRPDSITLNRSIGKISISWNTVPENDIRGYRIYADTVSLPMRLIDSTKSKMDTTINISTSLLDKKYYFRITAVDNANNESAFSEEDSLIVSKISETLTSTVENISIEHTAVGDTSNFFFYVKNIDIIPSHLTIQNVSAPFFIKNINDTLLPGIDSIRIEIIFTPDTFGTFVDTVNIQSDSQKISLPTISASPTPQIALLNSQMDFSEVVKNSTDKKLLRITNSSINVLTIDSLKFRRDYYFIEVKTGSVKKADTLQIEISFSPKDTVQYNDTLSIYSNSATSPVYLVITGKGKITTGVGRDGNSIPSVFSLDQNFPNPFNPTTTIRFGIPHSANVSLKIYDIVGREIAEIVNGELQAGYYRYSFNAAGISSGMSSTGGYASGVYFYRLTAASKEQEKIFVSVKKLLIVK